jgi:hypothetical protein
LNDHIAEETFFRWIDDPVIRAALSPADERVGQKEQRRQESQEEECVITFPLDDDRLVWDAWDDLLIHHSPFKAADSERFRELTKTLSELEQLVMENPGLHEYYRGCMGLTDKDLELPATKATPSDPVNLIVMQIQLMEDAYFALRLDLYANARDNRGWMNLFRRWAKSETFERYFKTLQTMYSNDFVTFYCHYIHDWKPIDAEPVPHAWDVAHVVDRKKHAVAWECQQRGAKGLFLDSGRRETRALNRTAPPTPPTQSKTARSGPPAATGGDR